MRAILAGRKTVTRRVVKGLPATICSAAALPESSYKWRFADFGGVIIDRACPYGWPPRPLEPPDRLWVRETWQLYRDDTPEQREAIRRSIERIQGGASRDIVTEVSNWTLPAGERKVLYAADFGEWAYDVDSDLKPWKSPLLMPRWASRILLRITDIRVERLQDITEEGAIAEGVERVTSVGPCRAIGWRDYSGGPGFFNARDSCATAWNKINGKKAPWESNPFVWVISFERIK